MKKTFFLALLLVLILTACAAPHTAYEVQLTATPMPTPAPTPDPTLAPAVATATPRLYLLTKGSTGTSVRNLQARLIELGYLNGEADGIYGKATENAVRDFQLRNGLKVDGKAGLQTQEKLFYAQDVVAAK